MLEFIFVGLSNTGVGFSVYVKNLGYCFANLYMHQTIFKAIGAILKQEMEHGVIKMS